MATAESQERQARRRRDDKRQTVWKKGDQHSYASETETESDLSLAL